MWCDCDVCKGEDPTKGGQTIPVYLRENHRRDQNLSLSAIAQRGRGISTSVQRNRGVTAIQGPSRARGSAPIHRGGNRGAPRLATPQLSSSRADLRSAALNPTHLDIQQDFAVQSRPLTPSHAEPMDLFRIPSPSYVLFSLRFCSTYNHLKSVFHGC